MGLVGDPGIATAQSCASRAAIDEIDQFFLLINNHLFYLPDGDMDAKSFERFAWENSQDGFLNNLQ